jgi:hypothetical protein
MAIRRRKKYIKHPRRYKKESSNENGGDPPTHLPTNTQPHLPTPQPHITPTPPRRTLRQSPSQSSTSTSCQSLTWPSPSLSPRRSPHLSSPPTTKRMKRDDEANEMQLRKIIAECYRLVLNNPPEKGYRAHDKFPGWEGDDGLINHIQQHFGLDQRRRTKIKRIVHSIKEYSNRGCTYRGQRIIGDGRNPLVTSQQEYQILIDYVEK